MARIIDQLSRTTDPEQDDDTGLYAVDYRDLRIQHLGSIYERLLELHPEIAEEVTVNDFTGDEIPVGHVFLRTERGDRRSTGSYYTPDQITDYLVAETLAPLCREIDERLRDEIRTVEDRIQHAKDDDEIIALKEIFNRLIGDFDDRVLKLRVLDPAMGSGHFLLSACKFLAEEIATNPMTRDPDYEQLEGDEPSLTFWKRKVVEHCLYGVDQNPLAVELAKLALWLETVSSNHPLTFLDHHIKTGDSLIGATLGELRHLPGSAALFRTSFAEQVAQQIPSFLEPLREISLIPSTTTDQVKEKERLLRQFNDRLQPFVCVADLWCACFYLPAEEHPTEAQYEQAISEMSHPVRLARMTEEPWFRRALAMAKSAGPFFHWELEFPGAFFAAGARRDDAGFDAVIGNPPYDVLSELETGRNLDGLRAFVDYVGEYRPSIRGKNNLYKLFICRATQFLAPNGRFGFIVPMPLLGDDQALGIRNMLFSVGRFTGIEAFPQKDDPTRRVFPEAKLSTTAFTFHKTNDDDLRKARFVTRTHRAQWIETDSPTLSLATSEIPLYDPENLAIPSCSQEDWDLAVRIMASGRMARLGTVCVSYQGEVNETNESKPGRNAISTDEREGPLILRGSNLTLYMVREASQGEPRYLRRDAFLAGKAVDSKAFHHRHRRVGFQRSSPQNNFRRIVAASIDAGQFCFDTVSYIPEPESRLGLAELLALLNSQLLDWYFRLGSTNSKVNEYQFNNLPVPRFGEVDADARVVAHDVVRCVDAGDFEGAFVRVLPHLATPPFSGAVTLVLKALVERIIAHEARRGPITRRERANLSPEAQPFQDLIESILFAAAGITADEAAGLCQRLEQML